MGPRRGPILLHITNGAKDRRSAVITESLIDNLISFSAGSPGSIRLHTIVAYRPQYGCLRCNEAVPKV